MTDSIRSRRAALAIALALVLVLAGCGGGGTGATPTPREKTVIQTRTVPVTETVVQEREVTKTVIHTKTVEKTVVETKVVNRTVVETRTVEVTPEDTPTPDSEIEGALQWSVHVEDRMLNSDWERYNISFWGFNDGEDVYVGDFEIVVKFVDENGDIVADTRQSYDKWLPPKTDREYPAWETDLPPDVANQTVGYVVELEYDYKQ